MDDSSYGMEMTQYGDVGEIDQDGRRIVLLPFTGTIADQTVFACTYLVYRFQMSLSSVDSPMIVS